MISFRFRTDIGFESGSTTMKHLLISLTLLAFIWNLRPPYVHAVVPNNEPGLLITADMQFNYAQTLFEQKDFTAAQIELKRFIHFFPQDPRHNHADYTAGAALYHSGQFYEAAKRFDTIIGQAKDRDSP